MLRFLSIANFAVIDRVQVEFEDGLNVLTGETGSGKSIIVDALELLFGGRGSAEMVRSGEAKLFVEGAFEVPLARDALGPLLNEAGIDLESELIIRREIASNGRSRSFICGQMVTTTLLRQIRPFLVDTYGQGEQQTLLDRTAHLFVLDNFGNLGTLAARVKQAYEQWQLVQARVSALTRSESERLRQRDVWQFESDEIARLAPVAGEDVELQRERSLLVNAERVSELASFSYSALYEQENSIISELATVKRKLDELQTIDPSLGNLGSQVDSCRYAVEDVAYTLRDYLTRVESSPARLAQVEERLVELERLKRKYGGSLDRVIEHLAQTTQQLADFETGEAAREQALRELAQVRQAYQQVALDLSQARKEAAKLLEKRLVSELKPLAMENVRFAVRFDDCSLDEPPRPQGLNSVEFFLSPNIGEDLRPLSRVASGGELSRLMLAIKSVMSPLDYPRTLVFDEVDAGVSGRVAQRVGERLRQLADHNQILSVTHQAQIARFADAHYKVAKQPQQGRTVVTVTRLGPVEREQELASLLGGVKITEATRLHAAELLKTAPRRKQQTSKG